MYRIFVIAALGTVLLSGALAQSLGPTRFGSGGDIDALVGSTVTAKAPVPVRESPPHGLLVLPGKKIAELTEEDAYQIVDAMVLPYVFSYQTWVQLSRGNSNDVLGWSYFGEDASESTNFALVQ